MTYACVIAALSAGMGCEDRHFRNPDVPKKIAFDKAFLHLLRDSGQSELEMVRDFAWNIADALYAARCSTPDNPRRLMDVLKLDCLPHAKGITCAGLMVDRNAAPAHCHL